MVRYMEIQLYYDWLWTWSFSSNFLAHVYRIVHFLMQFVWQTFNFTEQITKLLVKIRKTMNILMHEIRMKLRLDCQIYSSYSVRLIECTPVYLKIHFSISETEMRNLPIDGTVGFSENKLLLLWKRTNKFLGPTKLLQTNSYLESQSVEMWQN